MGPPPTRSGSSTNTPKSGPRVNCYRCNEEINGLSQEQRSQLSKLPAGVVTLYCEPCRVAVGQLEDRVRALEEAQKSDRADIALIVKEIVSAALPEIMDAIDSKISEQLERKSKRLNLVLVGCCESAAGDELEGVVKGACTALKIDPGDVERTFRDGRRREDHPRIAKIQFKNGASRHQFLVGFRAVRAGLAGASNAWVRPDLTFAQRQQDQKLREELKRRREAGEEVKIQQGKIVPKVQVALTH